MTTRTELKVPFVDLNAQYASIREEIDDTVLRVLASGQFVGGEGVEKFEEEFAHFVGSRYAVGVGSGTEALVLALRVANIGRGDQVIVPANSFFATAEAVTSVGAEAVFADVDPTTFLLDIPSVQNKITSQTRAVIPVHLYGRAMDLARLQGLADAHNFVIIEDAAQAHGTQVGGRPIGGSGRLTCFSFYPGKNLGAYGEGGAITCNDASQAEQLRLLRNHGSPKKYSHTVVGTNSRLDALQAAVLSVKLRHLPLWNSLRVRHAEAYATFLRDSLIRPPAIPASGEHNFHLFVVRLQGRDILKQFLHEQGIETGIHYPVPLHLTDAYQSLGYSGKGSLPVCEMLANEILSLPMYPELGESQLEYVSRALHEFTVTREDQTNLLRMS